MQSNSVDTKREEETALRQPSMRSENGDETDVLFECLASQIEFEEACPIIRESSSPDDVVNDENLYDEV